MRFTASGALDPTYGARGVARFNFGLPTPSEYKYAGPPVFGLDATIDQQDRVLLVVAEQEVVAGPHYPDFDEVPKLLARLNPTGGLDGTFGEDGTAPIPSTVVYGLGADREGLVQLGVSSQNLRRGDTGFGLLRLLADGLPVASFGSAGVRSFGNFGPAEALAVEADGGSLVLGWDPERWMPAAGKVTPVMRVGSRRGRPQGFGGGSPESAFPATASSPRSSPTAAAAPTSRAGSSPGHQGEELAEGPPPRPRRPPPGRR